MSASPADSSEPLDLRHLRAALTIPAPDDRSRILEKTPPRQVASALATLPPIISRNLFESVDDPVIEKLRAVTPAATGGTPVTPAAFDEGTVGHLMRESIGIVPEEVTAAQAVELVRRIASPDLTYLYAIDISGRLSGVVVMRDLFLAAPEEPVSRFMIRPPFFLTPEMTLLDAMHAVVGKHFPVYPVCTSDGILIGLVRGYVLFENQVITITAQAGKLVGVHAAEKTESSFAQSLRMRLPWLLVNLVLSLVSALVMLFYKQTLAQFIILAVFLTVVTTQGRNSGAQTMALVLRGLTAGTWQERYLRNVLTKEMLLGASGGAVVGLLAAVAIWVEEAYTGNPRALVFAATVFTGMVLGCATSCAAGVAMPLVLRRLGFDPALAASILLTNLCTVSCQILFLSLAVWWLV